MAHQSPDEVTRAQENLIAAVDWRDFIAKQLEAVEQSLLFANDEDPTFSSLPMPDRHKVAANLRRTLNEASQSVKDAEEVLEMMVRKYQLFYSRQGGQFPLFKGV